ncbi:hypothetical protein RAA17_10455 [Komagataeibacter rhaeticus]|nr:hypothetical protein [Komagataeibacter rhaeticus]
MTNHVPIGGQASDLTDPASITLQAPTISKTISASNLPTNDGVATTTSSGNIVSGETRTTTITVAVPEGTLTNGDGDVTVVETLPAGMDYAGDFVEYPGGRDRLQRRYRRQPACANGGQ